MDSPNTLILCSFSFFYFYFLFLLVIFLLSFNEITIDDINRLADKWAKMYSNSCTSFNSFFFGMDVAPDQCTNTLPLYSELGSAGGRA